MGLGDEKLGPGEGGICHVGAEQGGHVDQMFSEEGFSSCEGHDVYGFSGGHMSE